MSLLGTLTAHIQRLSIIGDLFVILFCSILGIIFFREQHYQLKFKIVETNLSRATLNSIIEKVGNDLGWQLYFVNDKVIVAKTHPQIFSGSWGEQITILFDRNKVLKVAILSKFDATQRSGSADRVFAS